MTHEVAIIGGGAMGGVWAARLAAAGTDVVIIDPAAALGEAVRERGLRIDGSDGSITAHPAFQGDADGVGQVDVVFVFVKARHTAAAADTAAAIAGPNTTVVSLQNGWGNADVLAGRVDPELLVIGVTYHSATTAEPGVVRHTSTGPTFLGPFGGQDVGRADGVAALLTRAGINVTVSAEIRTEIWRKLILNAATLPTAALTGLAAGQLGQPGPMLDLVDRVALETVEVAQRLGYDIDPAERLERIHTILAGGGTGRPSMLQDVLAHRLTEVAVINAAVVRAADDVGLPVPLNRAMTALIGGLERSWES
jgi:2-dehydropantoate 2-reductase